MTVNAEDEAQDLDCVVKAACNGQGWGGGPVSSINHVATHYGGCGSVSLSGVATRIEAAPYLPVVS
jgi:hypothetical protein